MGHASLPLAAEPPKPGAGLRALWGLAGVVAVAVGVQALLIAVGPGLARGAGAQIAVPAGIATLLIGAAIEAPRARLVQWVLIAISALVIALGGATLVHRTGGPEMAPRPPTLGTGPA
ncbi:MAG: hypothetical protein HYU41_11140 [Candidatus Rokubacteria bacterium]|nr:hypothetical protein [Candidatus Rokubacteria bacterium]